MGHRRTCAFGYLSAHISPITTRFVYSRLPSAGDQNLYGSCFNSELGGLQVCFEWECQDFAVASPR